MTMEFNTFYNEDCLDTMKKMEPNSIHCVITSPPYNMTKRKGGYADKQPRYDEYQDWKNEEEYNEWTCDIFNNIDKIQTTLSEYNPEIIVLNRKDYNYKDNNLILFRKN